MRQGYDASSPSPPPPSINTVSIIIIITTTTIAAAVGEEIDYYLVGKNAFMSSVLAGHPKTEKGKRPELNQVSSTSSSCDSCSSPADTWRAAAAFERASDSL
jgi:hypothetical protein